MWMGGREGGRDGIGVRMVRWMDACLRRGRCEGKRAKGMVEC